MSRVALGTRLAAGSRQQRGSPRVPGPCPQRRQQLRSVRTGRPLTQGPDRARPGSARGGVAEAGRSAASLVLAAGEDGECCARSREIRRHPPPRQAGSAAGFGRAAGGMPRAVPRPGSAAGLGPGAGGGAGAWGWRGPHRAGRGVRGAAWGRDAEGTPASYLLPSWPSSRAVA